MKMPKLPKWLKIEYVTQAAMVFVAALNVIAVIDDHSAWLNAGAAGVTIGALFSTVTIGYFIRRLCAAEALLNEQQDMIKALMEIKTAEIAEAMASHLGTEVRVLGQPPRVTKH